MIHHLQEQQRQHSSEWVSQPVPCPPRQPLPAGAVPAPSNPAAPSQLLPRQPGVTPTKAGAAPATLGLCPATWLRNLFLGASCHEGTLLCGPGAGGAADGSPHLAGEPSSVGDPLPQLITALNGPAPTPYQPSRRALGPLGTWGWGLLAAQAPRAPVPGAACPRPGGMRPLCSPTNTTAPVLRANAAWCDCCVRIVHGVSTTWMKCFVVWAPHGISAACERCVV